MTHRHSIARARDNIRKEHCPVCRAGVPEHRGDCVVARTSLVLDESEVLDRWPAFTAKTIRFVLREGIGDKTLLRARLDQIETSAR